MNVEGDSKLDVCWREETCHSRHKTRNFISDRLYNYLFGPNEQFSLQLKYYVIFERLDFWPFYAVNSQLLIEWKLKTAAD